MIAIRGVADVNGSSPFVGKRRSLAPCGAGTRIPEQNGLRLWRRRPTLVLVGLPGVEPAPTDYERNGGAQCAAHRDNLNEDMVK